MCTPCGLGATTKVSAVSASPQPWPPSSVRYPADRGGPTDPRLDDLNTLVVRATHTARSGSPRKHRAGGLARRVRRVLSSCTRSVMPVFCPRRPAAEFSHQRITRGASSRAAAAEPVRMSTLRLDGPSVGPPRLPRTERSSPGTPERGLCASSEQRCGVPPSRLPPSASTPRRDD